MDTEIKLKLWRGGQPSAERLAGNILHLDGFTSVDPQCPLGGPDGLKDVICEKNSWRYVGAAYFPPTEQTFTSVKKKYVHDLEGVKANGVDGIVFITNQNLTPSNRKKLVQLATDQRCKSIIYHLERIRLLLDSPSGYGVRLEFLDIDMSREEQLSFFSQWNRSFSEELRENSLLIIRELSRKIDSIGEPAELFSRKFHELIEATNSTLSSLGFSAKKSNKSEISIPHSGPASQFITKEFLCMLHRALLLEHPHAHSIGELRKSKVWIGGPGSLPETAIYNPPNPEMVPALVDELLAGWKSGYTKLAMDKNRKEIISGITRFHHKFLQIHPFLDGNGRLARFLLMQQANELLNHTSPIVIEDRKPYFEALEKAALREVVWVNSDA